MSLTEPGQEYFQNLAIADFSEIRGHRGRHFRSSPGFTWKGMQPSPIGAAATFFQYSRPVSIAYFLQLAGLLTCVDSRSRIGEVLHSLLFNSSMLDEPKIMS